MIGVHNINYIILKMFKIEYYKVLKNIYLYTQVAIHKVTNKHLQDVLLFLLLCHSRRDQG